MTTKAKILVSLLAIAGLAIAVWSVVLSKSSMPLQLTSTEADALYVDGIHYRTLENPPAAAAPQASKTLVSVQEFFWYGCPHCQAFEPRLRQWLQTAKEVDFQQLPVAWNELTRLHAAVYFAASDAENAENLHDQLFEQIIGLRQERNMASQIERIAEVFAEHGIDSDTLKQQLESPLIQARIDAAAMLMKQAQVSSTPTVLVGGKWVVLNNEEVGKSGLFNVIDYLVQKARLTGTN